MKGGDDVRLIRWLLYRFRWVRYRKNRKMIENALRYISLEELEDYVK